MWIIKKIFKLIKDIIAPKKCYSCNEEWHFLCEDCVKKLKNFESFCYICKRPHYNFEVHKECLEWIYFDKIVVLTHYKNKIIKKLIKDWKYYNKKDIFEDFWEYLWELFLDNENIKDNSDYLIIETPMYFLRKFKRWYNHSDILASCISENTNIKYEKNLIKKIKNSEQQSKNSKLDRIKNLQNSFKFNKNKLDKIINKNIILVDDVVSTGTTINELSRILKENGAKKVIWLVIASD